MSSKQNILTPKRGKDVDMTTGNITRHIISFALPLLIGNIFQQLYNTVDTWVVGKFVSNEAYAAVGTVGPIINMLIGFFMGLSSGAGVVISQYYGAKRFAEVEKTVHTAIAMTLILGIAFTGLGLFMTPYMLTLMKTPENVLPLSAKYMRIYFCGMIFTMVYNFCASILRAAGDTKSPLIFLTLSGILNVGLNIFFVLYLHMTVDGVALATVISQAVSALLTVICLIRETGPCKLELSKLHIEKKSLLRVLRIGLPAGIQSVTYALSNLIIQASINDFGTDVNGNRIQLTIESIRDFFFDIMSGKIEPRQMSGEFDIAKIKNM